MIRRTAVLRALTGVVLASATVLACNDDAAPAHAPTSTVKLDPGSAVAIAVAPDEAAPTVPIEEIQSIPSDPRITLNVVEGILPSPAATSAVLGIASGAWVLEPNLGQEFEGFDFHGSGMTAGWMARFQPVLTPAAGATLEGVYLSTLAFHGTPEDAERTYQYIRGVIGVHSGDERETIADAVSMWTLAGDGEGVGQDESTVSGIVIRQRTVTVLVGVFHAENRDVSAGLRDFARMLALGIDEFVRSSGP